MLKKQSRNMALKAAAVVPVAAMLALGPASAADREGSSLKA